MGIEPRKRPRRLAVLALAVLAGLVGAGPARALPAAWSAVQPLPPVVFTPTVAVRQILAGPLQGEPRRKLLINFSHNPSTGIITNGLFVLKAFNSKGNLAGILTGNVLPGGPTVVYPFVIGGVPVVLTGSSYAPNFLGANNLLPKTLAVSLKVNPLGGTGIFTLANGVATIQANANRNFRVAAGLVDFPVFIGQPAFLFDP